jgi:hypothetical protein
MRAMVVADHPTCIGEWQVFWDDRRREVDSDGYYAVLVQVMPATFAKFCQVHNHSPCWGSLGHYITAKTVR